MPAYAGVLGSRPHPRGPLWMLAFIPTMNTNQNFNEWLIILNYPSEPVLRDPGTDRDSTKGIIYFSSKFQVQSQVIRDQDERKSAGRRILLISLVVDARKTQAEVRDGRQRAKSKNLNNEIQSGKPKANKTKMAGRA